MTSRVLRKPPRVAQYLLFAMAMGLVSASLLASPAPPAKTQTIYCGFWRVDGGFASTIRIHNALITAPLTVTPVLFMADGTEYDLPAVQLPASGVTTVDLSQSLSNAPAGVARHLSEFGSAALRYQYPRPGAVLASMQILNTGQSMVFTYPFSSFPDSSVKQQTLEGLWWKHDPGVSGFVALANATGQRTQATLKVIGSEGTTSPGLIVVLRPHATQMLDLAMLLVQVPHHEGKAGGLRVRFTGEPGSIAVSGGLLNAGEGYSALIPFSPHGSGSVPPQNVTFASAGIMLGDPGSMMGFPEGTRFIPYAVARNTSPNPLRITPVVYYTSGGQPTSVPLPIQRLEPHETRELNLVGMFAAAGLANFSGNATLTFSYSGSTADLLLATGSIDRTGTFVFAVAPDLFGPSLSKEVCFWSVADGDDTMVSLWNPGDAPEDLLVTLYFAEGSGHYKVPVHVPARAEADLDLMELIMMQQPDADGNVMPMDVRQGSAVVSGPQDVTDPIEVSLSLAVFNAATATCSTGCTNCAGFSSLEITDDPFAFPVGATHQLTATAFYSNGTPYNKTSVATWSSNNTAVATVSGGLVNGVSPGNPNISAFVDLNAVGLACQGMFDENGNPVRCPLNQEFDGSAGGVVATLTCSPSSLTRAQTVQCTVQPSTATVSNWKFTDANNSTVSRTTSTGSLTWPGVMVKSGTVSVTVGGMSSPLTQNITVQPRGWSLSPATATETFNGDFVTLPVPPQPLGLDSGLGVSQEITGDGGFSGVSTISDNGPNNGYGYYAGQATFSTTYKYIINPDLENSSSTFYNAQCGNYNANTNPSGYIAGTTLLTQTNRHEHGSTASHYAEYSASLSGGNDPAKYFEARVAAPGFSATQFDQDTRNGLGTQSCQCGLYENILIDFSEEPPGVNEDAAGTFLGNINYAPYAACH